MGSSGAGAAQKQELLQIQHRNWGIAEASLALSRPGGQTGAEAIPVVVLIGTQVGKGSDDAGLLIDIQITLTVWSVP